MGGVVFLMDGITLYSTHDTQSVSYTHDTQATQKTAIKRHNPSRIVPPNGKSPRLKSTNKCSHTPQ